MIHPSTTGVHMKSLIAVLLLSASAAHAQCVFVPGQMHCVDLNQAFNQEQERQRQQQQINQVQRQLEQQRRLNEVNAFQSQQHPSIRQQCFINVFNVMECR
jgi:sensor histidine kinase YesM